MDRGGRIRHGFLTWGRPLAPAAAAVAYGVFYAVRPSVAVRHELLLLVVSVFAALAYLVVARARGDETALRIALPLDTLLIAGMTLAVGHAELVAVAYFWAVGLAAFLLGPRDTIANAAIAATCAAVVPHLGSSPVNELSQVTDVIVILLLGGLLAAMSRQQEQATHALELARAHDSVALRVAARIRASLDIDDVLHATVEEVGNAVGASRVRIRLGDVATTSMPLHEWRRRDLSVLAFTPPAPPIARVLATGEPVIVSDSGLADAELQAFVEGFSARALIVRPIFWGERVVAALGIFSDTPRVWESESELLDTIVPQIGAAIAQAEAYQHQVRIGRLRDELVANVSHELRTPLTATIGFLVTLERDDVSFSPERRRELLGIAREEAQRLARLVDDLLELTRFERGGVALVRGHVELRALAERVASTLDVPPDREIQVDFDEPLDVVADGDRLVQVLSNLVTNAVRHGAGPVGVHGRRENGEAVVAVWDDGEEIAASRAEEIFEPFARWSGRSDSTGLGLPIARRIMEAHGGSLSYRAPAHGRPHAFVMRLPQR